MADGFFDNINKVIDASRADEAASKDRLATAKAFSIEQIAKAGTVSQNYAEQLRLRKIKVLCLQQTESLCFDMHWRDGASHGLWLVIDPASGGLQFTYHSANHDSDNRRTTSRGMDLYDHNSWKPEIFTEHLESEIQMFIELASYHGGLG